MRDSHVFPHRARTLSLKRSLIRMYDAPVTHMHRHTTRTLASIFSTRKGKVVRGYKSRPPILPHTNPPLALVSASQSVSHLVSQLEHARPVRNLARAYKSLRLISDIESVCNPSLRGVNGRK